jgi:hypothetical protein
MMDKKAKEAQFALALQAFLEGLAEKPDRQEYEVEEDKETYYLEILAA